MRQKTKLYLEQREYREMELKVHEQHLFTENLSDRLAIINI